MSTTRELDRHAAVYRRLLGFYPRGYRREVGEQAVAAFRDLCRARMGDGGRWALARVWLSTVPRLVWGGLVERVADGWRAARPASTGRVGDGARAGARGGGAPAATPVGPPYVWAALTAALVFLLYVVTLAPTTAFWDTSEYITTAHILGVAHPPGNPLFVVLARAWELLLAPLGLSVAVRINLFSAFMSAAAHGLWFLVVHHILRYFSTDRAFRLVGAFAAVLVSATAFTVWNQSNVNEKVYTVSLLTIALLTWLAFRWQENLGKGKDDRLLVLMAFILALSVGNHLMAFLAAPALAAFILLVRPRVLTNWTLYPAVLGAAVAGLSIHLYLPLRAALDPVINQGDPTCDSLAGALTSIVTWGKAGCVALSEAITRQQFTGPPGTPGPGTVARQAPLGSQLLNYVQYFDWQWARSVQGTNELFANLRIPFTMLFTGLGVWGAVEHARRDRASFAYVLTLFATLSVALVGYLNFEYGFSIPDPFGDPDLHEVRERDYFFIVSFSVWGLWAGIGIAALWEWLHREVVGSLARAAPVLLLAGIPLLANGSWADRSYDYAARDWAYNLLQSVEPYGVLFTGGDNDTFPLWYLQEVEGLRKDVTVIVTSYLDTPWYAKQLRDLTRPCSGGAPASGRPTRITCQRSYEPDARTAYTARPDTLPRGRIPLVTAEPVRRPERPVLELDDVTIERVARTWVPLERPRSVRLGSIRPEIPGGQYLRPWHQYALAIVDTAFADGRPVYWASSARDYESLGLDPYLVRQGLAYRLSDRPLERAGREGVDRLPEGVVRLPEDYVGLATTGRYVDVPRTDTLMNEVFVHRSGLPRWDHWPDPSTVGIPYYYAWGYEALALAAFLAGEAEDSVRYRRRADAWRRLGQ